MNPGLAARPGWIERSPYEGGWVCLLNAVDWAGEFAWLRVVKPVVDWYPAEIARRRQVGGPAERGALQVNWGVLQAEFLTQRVAA